MPQQSFDNSRTPWRIAFELKEDPLAPSKPPVATVTVWNGVGEVLTSRSCEVPPGFACEAFAEMCRGAMEPYSFARPASVSLTWQRLAKEWRDAVEAITPSR